MYIVKVINECSCFIKSDLESEKEFSDSFEASMYAQDLIDEMNKSFCKKHKFRLDKSYDGKTLKIVIH